MDSKGQSTLYFVSGAIYAGLEPVLAYRCAMTPWGLKLHTHVLSKTRGEPCAICQSRWTAVVQSYDCLAKGDLHHSYRQGCVANMADVMIGSILHYCSAIAMLRYKQMVGAVIQSQIPRAGDFFPRRIHVTLKGIEHNKFADVMNVSIITRKLQGTGGKYVNGKTHY